MFGISENFIDSNLYMTPKSLGIRAAKCSVAEFKIFNINKNKDRLQCVSRCYNGNNLFKKLRMYLSNYTLI